MKTDCKYDTYGAKQNSGSLRLAHSNNRGVDLADRKRFLAPGQFRSGPKKSGIRPFRRKRKWLRARPKDAGEHTKVTASPRHEHRASMIRAAQKPEPRKSAPTQKTKPPKVKRHGQKKQKQDRDATEKSISHSRIRIDCVKSTV